MHVSVLSRRHRHGVKRWSVVSNDLITDARMGDWSDTISEASARASPVLDKRDTDDGICPRLAPRCLVNWRTVAG